jgi:nucleotide-binding universal stress UspA family protein
LICEVTEMKQPICPAPWQTLLVCSDGSAEAANAVSQTLALAGSCGGQVFVLRVLEIVPEFEAAVPDLRAQLERQAREEMAAIEAQAAGAGAAVKTMLCHSQLPYAAIIADAEKVGADVIIMGRSGRSAMSRLLMGSVTARVIGHSPINVLVVPGEASLGFRRLLVASDGSPCSDGAWREALRLARSAEEVQLYALSAAREEGEIIEAQEVIRRLLAAANQEGIALTALSPQGQQPDDAIVQDALRNLVDLIIIGSHGRTGFHRLLMGSVAERVIGQAPCPVLVVKKG